ncbi:hypothetical protein A2303_02385 [Candidatus Falkowbacteria bacterium RIFOXYB2_FULL_47_14]|nr:MAG: hypothetical protein A2468_01195 [Candidatus Falkowbacteria bacterium RIFOXYC2_FULL_46_15]OGF43910.1 MAG: hypothetical protein A2303_02385 [Candidatus Falkowbacteria bacterium RIFOXYB2_FULL_47_14]
MKKSFISAVILAAAAAFVLMGAPMALAITFTPEVPIPGSGETVEIQDNLRPIGGYVANIYRYAIGGVGILAAVVMMFGGVIWITAGGNASRVGEAKAWIGAALSGLVLALLSYMVLNAINPALVEFKTYQTITPISSGGCCIYRDGGRTLCASVALDECLKLDNGSFTNNSTCQSGTCVPMDQ